MILNHLSFTVTFLLATFIGSNAQNLLSGTHESDAQNQILLNFDLAGFSTNPTDYIVSGGAISVTSVVPSGTNAILVLGSVLPAGSSVVSVNYVPTGDNINSENNRLITCSDFTFAGFLDASDQCAPVTPESEMIFAIKPGARNSSNWDLSKITGRVTWINVGVAPFTVLSSNETDLGGNNVAGTFFVAFDTDDFIVPSNPFSKYQYPVDNAVCGYTSNWNVRLLFPPSEGVTTNCPLTSAPQTQVYASHNDDNTGDDAGLALNPDVPNSDLVCLGTNADITFRDDTDLNCNPTTPPIPTNDAIRWVRVVYGSTDLGGGNTATSNIPNIEVGGVQVTDANGNLLFPGGFSPVAPAATTFGAPDAFGVVEVLSPVTNPRGLIERIITTSPLGQVVGQRFWVRLDYWNKCNAYDGFGDVGNERVSVERFIEIIDIPPAPTPVDDAICQGDGLGGVNFEITGTAGSTIINWYDNDPNLGGNLTANPNGTNSATFPATSFPGGIDTNIPGDYSMWATYVLGATNDCESDPVEVVVTVREDLTQPNAFSIFSNSVCNGTNNVTFELPNPAGSTTFGGATEYQWSNTGGAGVN
ncbi:MAG: hypothetical protein AAF149_05300, partial [Bacteroidota bacterium]